MNSLITRVFQLLKVGQIKPFASIDQYSFEDVRGAFAHIRGGGHLGKTVLTRGIQGHPSLVALRPASYPGLKLRADSAYLLVGGLRGIGGSFAIFLARHGARSLVVLSRSGCNDAASRAVTASCDNLGCEIQEVIGDVTSRNDVQRSFEASTKPIRGVIQGAVVYKVDETFLLLIALTSLH